MIALRQQLLLKGHGAKRMVAPDTISSHLTYSESEATTKRWPREILSHFFRWDYCLWIFLLYMPMGGRQTLGQQLWL